MWYMIQRKKMMPALRWVLSPLETSAARLRSPWPSWSCPGEGVGEIAAEGRGGERRKLPVPAQ